MSLAVKVTLALGILAVGMFLGIQVRAAVEFPKGLALGFAAGFGMMTAVVVINRLISVVDKKLGEPSSGEKK